MKDIHSIVASVPHTEAAKIIAFHNAALDAQREKYSEWHQEALLRASTIQTLVDALKEISGNDCKYCDCQENSKIIADRALAKCIKK